MRQSMLWSVPILLALLAAGCAKPRFSYDEDPTFHAGSYRTVAVDPRKDRILIREGMRPLNPELHLKAVLTELTLRNYRTTPAAEADLWVTVYVLIGGQPASGAGGQGRSSHREGSGEGRRGGGRGGTGSGGASAAGWEGGAKGHFSVIVQLQDRKSDLPVWQGEANLDHKEKGTDGNPLSIEAVVHQLLQPLPVLP